MFRRFHAALPTPPGPRLEANVTVSRQFCSLDPKGISRDPLHALVLSARPVLDPAAESLPTSIAVVTHYS
jgi:hypothetical protein